ncbi:hypothetical protein CYY_008832 [Polysphondylium violaceum]|uniref:Fumarylacetoacetase-like C-terminal domain-containing protein n=1 Tax=Polysphondylium violaceum TaxID=133409 RepID=A0A8J4V3J7_9MYCE|nr:hypothetical protein CYY_008832 [Polysphondylium violaceum]
MGLIKLVTFENSSKINRLGVLLENSVLDICSIDKTIPSDMKSFLSNKETNKWNNLVKIIKENTNTNQYHHSLDNVRFKSPIDDPEKVIGIGLNYREHAIEGGFNIPTEPVVFSKFSSSIIGPNESIVKPKSSDQVDYEVELVVIIGKTAKNVDKESALDYVAGYTVGNDVSARDWQLKKNNNQWLLGKTFDTFAPIGPSILVNPSLASLYSGETFLDPNNLNLKCILNGQVMQDSSTKDFIFNVQEVVSYLSNIFTLKPGDVIFTGTPQGVGFTRNPPIFLKPGDVVECQVEHIGSLINDVKEL